MKMYKDGKVGSTVKDHNFRVRITKCRRDEYLPVEMTVWVKRPKKWVRVYFGHPLLINYQEGLLNATKAGRFYRKNQTGFGLEDAISLCIRGKVHLYYGYYE